MSTSGGASDRLDVSARLAKQLDGLIFISSETTKPLSALADRGFGI